MDQISVGGLVGAPAPVQWTWTRVEESWPQRGYHILLEATDGHGRRVYADLTGRNPPGVKKDALSIIFDKIAEVEKRIRAMAGIAADPSSEPAPDQRAEKVRRMPLPSWLAPLEPPWKWLSALGWSVDSFEVAASNGEWTTFGYGPTLMVAADDCLRKIRGDNSEGAAMTEKERLANKVYLGSIGVNVVDSTLGEQVDHPAHYGGAGNVYEAIKVIRAWGLGFSLGNVVKYISRAGKKGGDNADLLTDLRKSAWYLDEEIGELERRLGVPPGARLAQALPSRNPIGPEIKPDRKVDPIVTQQEPDHHDV